ncbi:MAG: Asp-tRNA(Asn)/Glu-tRNA(Gln) amidotransferase subunit GatA, partial [Candidatus Kapaibacterium sp.]
MNSYSSFLERRKSHSTTVVEELESFLGCIAQRSDLNVFLALNTEDARACAAESDRSFDDGTERPLEGMIVAVKDNISVQGLPLTCGSRMLGDFRPIYDATVVRRLKEHGAIIIGKTNCDEFAMGSSNETSAFGPVAHPLDADHVPGGSSGGSAVAVAAGMCHVSLGSDTGGSIRQPAAFCGVVGYKPTYGKISRFGLVAFASSLDQIGPFAHVIDDVAAIHDVMSGIDPMDSTSSPLPPDTSLRALHHHDDDVTVGVIHESLLEGCSDDIIASYRSCIGKVLESGYRTVTVELSGKDAWIPTYYILATAEASANLARFDGVRYGHRSPTLEDDDDVITRSRSEGFGEEVQRRIMLGTFVLSSGYYDAFYKKGQQARRKVVDGYASIFSRCDVLILPTTPTAAFKRGEKSRNPIEMYLNDLFTVSANLAGIPAISIPAGSTSTGLPIGIQLQ